MKYESKTIYARELKDDTGISAQMSREMAKAKSIQELKEEFDIDGYGLEEDRDFLVPINDGY